MTSPSIEPSIEPDTKDWTWVLDASPVRECGFVAADLDRADLGAAAPRRRERLGRRAAPARRRPSGPTEQTWSPLEYACHVRDVHRIFGERLALMLDQDEPDLRQLGPGRGRVAARYDLQDPAVVGPELVAAAEAVAARYDALREAPEETWARRGLRSNGSEFTVDSIARYHLHDVLHHTHDVRERRRARHGRGVRRQRDRLQRRHLGAQRRGARRARRVRRRRGRRGRVLEIGSAGGRDALAARGSAGCRSAVPTSPRRSSS